MPTMRFQRQFSAGSKPTPDPYDRFLDDAGLFRKHTARDTSSLFRVVSEFMYDTQDYHEQVRKDCVNFMIKHRHLYENRIDGDFNEYVKRMAKPDKCGTLVELRAMGYMFKRNILVFEPYELGTWLVNQNQYVDDEAWRVFYLGNGSHFDLVFTKSYAVDAAFCQSIAYETLYKDVFKLPDIEYSVEMMLHSTNDLETNAILSQSEFEYENDDNFATHISFKDGRRFQLDRPENTNCILENPDLCHFHNKDFDNIFRDINEKYPTDQRIMQRFVKSSLPDKYNSCVRQLLNSAITPFPYKVAKSLDPDIYRNIEFDSWNERRKTLKGNKKIPLEIGAKCLAKLDENADHMLKCYIQDIDNESNTCVVFVEKFSEKRTVSIDSICMLSEQLRHPKQYHDKGYFDACESEKCHDQHKMCGSSGERAIEYHSLSSENDEIDAIYKSFDFEAYTNLNNCHPVQPIQLIALPMQFAPSSNMATLNSNKLQSAHTGKSTKSRNSASQNIDTAPTTAHEKPQPTIALAEKDESECGGKNNHDNGKSETHPNEKGNKLQSTSAEDTPNADPNTAPNNPLAQQYMYGYNPAMMAYGYPQQLPAELQGEAGYYGVPGEIQQGYYAVPNVYSPASGASPHNYFISPNQMYAVPSNNFPAYNSPINQQSYVPGFYTQAINGSQPIFPLRRELLQTSGRANYNAQPSWSQNADDLPWGDRPTVRFFYNMGVEYFKYMASIYGMDAMKSMANGEYFCEPAVADVDPQMFTDFQQMQLDSTDPEGNGHGKNGNGYGHTRRFSKPHQKREYRPNQSRFQGQFQGYHGSVHGSAKSQKPAKTHGNSNNYDATPIKESNVKAHGQHTISNAASTNVQPKRFIDSTAYVANEHGNGLIFGSNVPPFPFHHPVDVNEHVFVSPHPPQANAFPRMTTPVAIPRTTSIPVGVSPYEPINDVKENAGQFSQYLHGPLIPPQQQQHQLLPIQHFQMAYQQMPNNPWTHGSPPMQQHQLQIHQQQMQLQQHQQQTVLAQHQQQHQMQQQNQHLNTVPAHVQLNSSGASSNASLPSQ